MSRHTSNTFYSERESPQEREQWQRKGSAEAQLQELAPPHRRPAGRSLCSALRPPPSPLRGSKPTTPRVPRRAPKGPFRTPPSAAAFPASRAAQPACPPGLTDPRLAAPARRTDARSVARAPPARCPRTGCPRSGPASRRPPLALCS